MPGAVVQQDDLDYGIGSIQGVVGEGLVPGNNRLYGSSDLAGDKFLGLPYAHTRLLRPRQDGQERQDRSQNADFSHPPMPSSLRTAPR